jgi:phage tail-like protein
MDANGLRFWMLADEPHWNISADNHVHYDSDSRSLQLASERILQPLAQGQSADLDADARTRLERIPQTIDAFGMRARWDAAAGALIATGVVPDPVAIYMPAGVPTDLAMGYDGALYLAVAGRIVMQDRRDRWSPVTLESGGIMAWRLAADRAGGAWVLDRVAPALARVDGMPLPDLARVTYTADTIRPCDENSNAPRITKLAAAAWPSDEEAVAIAAGPDGQLALLTWTLSGDARVRRLRPDGTFDEPTELKGAFRPYSLAWIDPDHVAVLLGNLPTEAPVYPLLGQGQSVLPMGDLYPLRQPQGEPFVHTVTLPPHYVAGADTAPLYELSLPSFARQGEATNGIPLDSGSPQSTWHRLYLEAVLPAQTGVQVFMAAGDLPVAPADPNDWHEHRFGEVFFGQDGAGIPRGTWVSSPSEIPYNAGLLNCPPERDRAGLFTALIQRCNRPVRDLRGRYLWVRIVLTNLGRATPQIAALRVYASRFSYLDNYLPELYRETLFGDDAEGLIPRGAPSTRANFLERFLDNFEGILTPLEDRIADAYLLTDPRTTTDEALDWLGGWIGVTFHPAYPVERRRELLAATPELYRRRGTPQGLARALDIATGGGIGTGAIVLLEDFRLRRVLATIVGANLTETDVLVGGVVISDNSYVGDSLVLGDEHRKEFLALFDASLPVTTSEAAAIESFFDTLANRLTVLVHQDVLPQDLGLIRRIVELETPAHVVTRVTPASYPFIVGMASLVGVDTYLGSARKPEPVEVDRSQIGVRDVLEHPASLDPRLGGWLNLTPSHTPIPVPPAVVHPVADAGPRITATWGTSIHLDAGGSHAGGGGDIKHYIWTRLS